MAWVYPNSYELGMSNIGYQWLLYILKSQGHLLVERFFASHRSSDKSLESNRSIKEFPIIAMSMPFEMDILNFLGFLYRNGIPLLASDRPDGPLIVGGGNAFTLNPFPFSDFFDIIIPGCGEEWAETFPEILRELPPGLVPKEKILDEIAEIPGVWIPLRDDGSVIQRSSCIRKNPAFTPILTSYGHFRNMFLIELQRGCPFRCSFCSSNWLERPFENYSIDSIVKIYTEHGQDAKRIGVVGNAVAEHPHLGEIIDYFSERGARVSPSSIRFDRLNEPISDKLASTGIRTLTFAPETASKELAKNISKWIDIEDIIQYANVASKKGFRELKLYWIIGLPKEQDDDVIELANAIKKIDSSPGISLSCSINTFIPKPHTKFQYEFMFSDSEIKRRIKLLKANIGSKTSAKIEFNYSRQSRISAILSIGGSEITPVLKRIAEGGGIKTSFAGYGIDINAAIFGDENAPWERII